MEGKYKNIKTIINNIDKNKIIDIKKLLSDTFLYRIDFRQKNCCCVKTYDYTNDISELKEIYNKIDKSLYEVYLNFKINDEWLEVPATVNFIDCLV